MKAYTDLEQSKKLAEILPKKGADQTWGRVAIAGANLDAPEELQYIHKGDMPFQFYSGIGIPCWSLASLLDYLRKIDFFPSIEADEHGVTMSVCYFDEEEGELLHPMHDIQTEADNFVDALYEMILKLHELKML